MHEHGIADSLLRQARLAAEERGITNLRRVFIGLGRLSGVEAGPLLEALEHAAEETGLQGVDFSITPTDPAATCGSCGRALGTAYTCEACGSADVEIVAGLAVSVTGVEGFTSGAGGGPSDG